jgi:hypothetical protein
MSVKDAMLRHHQKQLKRTVRRKNNKPEKLVETACMKWFKAHGFSMDIIEGKGGRNAYGAITVRPGYVDCSGNDKYGSSVYVEFKARGRRYNLSMLQRKFLEEKIRTNCFAVVVDSAEILEEYYDTWSDIICPIEKRVYLTSLLPKSKVVDDDGELF